MRKAILAFLAFVLFAGTSQAGFFSRGIDDIFADIEVNGPTEKNMGELEGYVKDNPSGESADEALLRLSEIYSKKKDYSRAVEALSLLVTNFPASRFQPEAMFGLGFLNYRSGKTEDARTALKAVADDRDASLTLRTKAARLLKEIEAASNGLGESGAPAIGVLLPLKGSYARFGEDALSGVLLAAEVFGAQQGGRIEVIVKNVGSDPASVDAAITELADNENVVGLVGPLLSAVSIEAARSAQRREIPIITLSQKEGVTEAGDYVFRNFLTPADQAAALAEHAVNRQNLKAIGALFPQTNYGTELTKLFEMELKARGAELIRSASYQPGKTDFSDEMKRLFGVQVKERMEGRRKIKEYTPTVKIEGLFIPDSFEAASLIAPYLGYYNITDVKLLGPNSWNTSKLADLSGGKMEGAVFVDGFFKDSRRAGTSEFVKKFKEVYGREPGVLEAHAFDSARALVYAVGNESGTDREGVRDRLRSMRDFRGATGELYFNPRGEAVKRLFMLTVKNGKIVEAE